MKRLLFAAALAAATAPIFAADLGVSVRIGEPGFYGRLDIGDYPPPQLIYRQPIAVERVDLERPPIYLRVPPGHAKHWNKHCREYNACGERVLFVQDTWYDREYVPRFQERHRDRHEERGDERRSERRDEPQGDQRNDHRGDDHDHGRGR